MLLNWQTFTIHKRVPLRISRGTTSKNTNIWLGTLNDIAKHLHYGSYGCIHSFFYCTPRAAGN